MIPTHPNTADEWGIPGLRFIGRHPRNHAPGLRKCRLAGRKFTQPLQREMSERKAPPRQKKAGWATLF